MKIRIKFLYLLEFNEALSPHQFIFCILHSKFLKLSKVDGGIPLPI